MSDGGGSEADFQDDGPSLGTYVGERNADYMRHGQGKATLPGGDTYTGGYELGRRNGQGLYRFKNGAQYEGGYDNNMKHGKGVFHYPDGSIYDGWWSENMRSGIGKYTYANGDVYDGDWMENQRHGQGTYTYATTGSKFSGRWLNGKREGVGEWVHMNHSFSGTFSQDLPMGQGVFRFTESGISQHGSYTVINPPDDADIAPTDVVWMPSHYTTDIKT